MCIDYIIIMVVLKLWVELIQFFSAGAQPHSTDQSTASIEERK